MSLVDISALFNGEMDEHRDVAHATQIALQKPFEQWVHAIHRCFTSGGKLIFFGNGGSAADCQHLATEFTVRFKKNRPALPALALTTDTSALTAIGNDFSFEDIFARQIEALGKPHDYIIAISTSGRSPNILKALKTAKSMGIETSALTGHQGGDIVGLADLTLIVPSTTTSRIQEMHITLGQMLVGAIESIMGYD